MAGLAARAQAADAGAASMTLHGDLMTPGEPETTTVQGALGSGSGHEPKVIYLRYADGSETHTSNYDACNTGKVPKFECTFAPTLVECQRQIQAYLDAWYADFNVIFTLTRPTSGTYYTEVVSSGGGAWCKVDDKVAGVAPFLCKDLSGGVAYTFQGGKNARETAVIIAQEQAHLVGLEHTTNAHDIMFPTISPDTTGFVDGDSPITGDRCDREAQNSYRMMKNALGEWPGGPKPSAFGCMEDTQSPSVRFLSPGNGEKKGHAFAVTVDVRDDCDVKKVEIAVMPARVDRGRDGGAVRVGSDGHQRRADDHRHRDRRQRPHGQRDAGGHGARHARRAGAERERRRRWVQRRVRRVQRGGAGAVAGDVPALQRQEPPEPVAARPGRAHPLTHARRAPRELRVAHAAAERPFEREKRHAQQQQRRRRPDLDRLLAADAHLARGTDCDVVQLLERVAAA